jgi:predicted RNase H-like HicB family nuclease
LEYTRVFELQKDGSYVVYVKELPGCVSQGDNYFEACTNIADAMEDYLLVCHMEGVTPGESFPDEDN